MLPAFYDSQINICAFTDSFPILVKLQSFGFCSSLAVDFVQNCNDDAVPCLLSIAVCLFVCMFSVEELSYRLHAGVHKFWTTVRPFCAITPNVFCTITVVIFTYLHNHTCCNKRAPDDRFYCLIQMFDIFINCNWVDTQ
jgi:hypothetical protein